MPRRRNRSSSVTVSTTSTRVQPSVIVVPRRRTRRSRRNRNVSGQPSLSSSLPPTVAAYVATLLDPFEFPAIPLGWGTLVPTGTGTAFYRGGITVNSTDGSFGIVCLPWLNGGVAPNWGAIRTTSSGLLSNSWNPQDWSNAAQLAAAAGESRIVSIGLKVLPQVAATAAPGVIYAGNVSDVNYNMFATSGATASLSNWVGSPFLQMGYGNVGAIATGRPEDPTSYSFGTVSTLHPNLVTDAVPFTTPIVCGSGFPAGTTVFFECVMNFEYMYQPMVQYAALSMPVEADEARDSALPSLFPSLESMWNAIRPYVTHPTLVSSLENIASSGASAAIRAAAPVLMARTSTGSSRMNQVRHALGSGLAAGSAGAMAAFRSALFGNTRRLLTE